MSSISSSSLMLSHSLDLIKPKDVRQYYQSICRQFHESRQGISLWKRGVSYLRQDSPLDPLITLDNPKGVIAALECIYRRHTIQTRRFEAALKHLFRKVTTEELRGLCETVNTYALYSERAALIDCLTRLIDFQRFEEFAGGSETLVAILRDRAQRYATVCRPLPRIEYTPLEKRISLFRRFCHKISRIGELLFGFKDTIQRHNERFEAVHKFELYCKVVLFPATLFALINPLFFSVWVTAVIAISILLVGAIAIVAYYRWIKGCPEDLPEWRNLTNDLVNGRIQSQTVINSGILNIYHHVVASLEGKIPIRLLIVGESGVGKTETIHGVARLLLERGKKDLRVFYTDAGELMSKPLFTTPIQALDDIQKEVDGYEDKAVFVIDEFHAIGTKPELKNHFKRLLESNCAARLNFIGITTPEDYKQSIANDKALAGRFHIVKLEAACEYELKAILTNYAQSPTDTNFPVRFSKKAIDNIITLSGKEEGDRSQPAAGIKRIDEVRRKVIEMQSKQGVEWEKLESEKKELEAILRQRYDLDIDTEKGWEIRKKMDGIQQEIHQRQSKHRKSINGLKRIEYLKRYQAQLSAQMWEWAKAKNNREQAKQFVMAKYISLPAAKRLEKSLTKSDLFNDESFPSKVKVNWINTHCATEG